MESNLNDLEVSNSGLIFWNVETNKCFIISNTDANADCLQSVQTDKFSQNDALESKSIENELFKNIEEMRKILETDTGEVSDDVEEEMRKMFGENNTTSIMEDTAVPDQIQSEQNEVCTEHKPMEDDFAGFQLEESHYEQTIEIASEQPVESCHIASPTLCSEPENICEIVLNNEGSKNNNHVSTILEHYQTEHMKNIIANSIDDKRYRLQKIRNRISKIHIRLNKKRKYFECVRKKMMDTHLPNSSKETSSQTSTDSKTNRMMMNPKTFPLNRMKYKRNRKRKYQPPNILSHWRSKFEKEIRKNMNQLLEIPNKSLKVKQTMNISYTKQSPVRTKNLVKTIQKIKCKNKNFNTRQSGNKLKMSVKRKFGLEKDMPLIENEELSFETHSNPSQNIKDYRKNMCLSQSPTYSATDNEEEDRTSSKIKFIKAKFNKGSTSSFEKSSNEVIFCRVTKIIRSTTDITGNNKVFNNFLRNIDESAYHQSESFNLDAINYTFRWLQYILSRKLHKSEMETELEKLKVHYYRLFHLNIIGCCGSGTKIRKHCECSDKLNRIVFCTLMDTYVLRIVKYIILGFQNNFGNIVNSTETIAGFLSFFIDRSKILYFLFLYKSNFLQKEQIALEKTAKPKSLRSLTRMCLLKMICKNPKMHECMENIQEMKKTNECIEATDTANGCDGVINLPNTIPIQPPKKNFTSDYSIEKLLQKPIDVPLNLVLNKNENNNLNKQQMKRLINYRRQTIASECFESKSDSYYAEKGKIPPEIQVQSAKTSNSLGKTFVAVGNTSFELATMPDFVRGACQVINQRYPNITINPAVTETNRYLSKQHRLKQSRPSTARNHKRFQIDETRTNNRSGFLKDNNDQFYSNSKIWELLSSRYQIEQIGSSNDKRDKRNQIKYQRRQLFHGNEEHIQPIVPISCLKESEKEGIYHSDATSLQETFDKRIKVLSSIVLKPTEKLDHPKTIETILISDDSDVENLIVDSSATVKNYENIVHPSTELRKVGFQLDNAATENDRRRNEVLYEERRHYKFSQKYLSKHNYIGNKKDTALKSNEDNQSKKSILLGKYKESELS